MKIPKFQLNTPTKIVSIVLGILNAVFLMLFFCLALFGIFLVVLDQDIELLAVFLFISLLGAINFLLVRKLLFLKLKSWKVLMLGAALPILEIAIIYRMLTGAVGGLMNIG